MQWRNARLSFRAEETTEFRLKNELEVGRWLGGDGDTPGQRRCSVKGLEQGGISRLVWGGGRVSLGMALDSEARASSNRSHYFEEKKETLHYLFFSFTLKEVKYRNGMVTLGF